MLLFNSFSSFPTQTFAKSKVQLVGVVWVEEYTTDLIHTCIIILYSIAGITLASIKFGKIALHWYWQSGDLDAYHHMRAYIIWRIFNLVI